MMRKHTDTSRDGIQQDFERRVQPGLNYCQRVGNIMGATVLLSLASTIDHGAFDSPRRIGCFSYGSGCSSEFYSGVRSEEHTSELQSLMRISYAVFCLKKHTAKNDTHNIIVNTLYQTYQKNET